MGEQLDRGEDMIRSLDKIAALTGIKEDGIRQRILVGRERQDVR